MAFSLSPLGSPQLSPLSSPRPSFSSHVHPRSPLGDPPASSVVDIGTVVPGLLPSHRTPSSSSLTSSSARSSRSPLPSLHTNLAHAIGQAVWGSPDSSPQSEGWPGQAKSSHDEDEDVEGRADDEVYVTPEALSLFGYVRMPGCGILPWPGPTAESASVVRNVLQVRSDKPLERCETPSWETHVKFDCETTEGEPNTLLHHLLAVYSLGAPAETIKACYQMRMRELQPLPKMLDRPTDKTWRRWLGSSKHFTSYLAFFTERVATLGAVLAVERYLFADPTSQMLARACSCSNMLALATVGLGLEFDLDAVVAHGLAMAAVSGPRCAALFPTSWPPATGLMRSPLGVALTTKLSLRGFTPPSFVQSVKRARRPIPRHPRKGLSAFTIIASMAASRSFAEPDAASPHDSSPLDGTIRGCAEEVVTWCDEWIVDEDAGWDEIVEKAEELTWLATILFAATTRPDQLDVLDPVLAQMLCSIIAMPPLLEVLSSSGRLALLRSVFVLLVATWVSRGRPQLRILATLSRVAACPSAKYAPNFLPGGMVQGAAQLQRDRKGKGRASNGHTGSTPSSRPSTPPDESAVVLDEEPTTPKASRPVIRNGILEHARSHTGSSSRGGSPSDNASRVSSVHSASRMRMSSTNSWTAVIASAADHPDGLVARVVRALAFAGSLYGHTPAGQYRCALAGTESMDGSIFVRTAGLVLDSLGWRREGDEPGRWAEAGPRSSAATPR